jgi:hypothetical protein
MAPKAALKEKYGPVRFFSKVVLTTAEPDEISNVNTTGVTPMFVMNAQQQQSSQSSSSSSIAMLCGIDGVAL